MVAHIVTRSRLRLIVACLNVHACSCNHASLMHLVSSSQIYHFVQDGKPDALSTAQETAALLRGEGKKMLRKERKMKIENLRSALGLGDLQRTPKVSLSVDLVG